ncbi:Rho guanine exchange factor-like protein 1 [Sarcoptes scabiei]|uniref:Rho guanine exchange factor-like protein 1 n=1 Tax=Sarcoptes scabiei TaxID=52283 RepID=A0A132A1I7_SARSC|nr:Rho guanine exchange factor-like protein 1 [Sarcoptes scabiei]
MEQLTELLKQYSDNGIPDPKHLLPITVSSNRLNHHLRASSLSITGYFSNSGPSNLNSPNTPPSPNSIINPQLSPSSTSTTLLSTTKNSLSTTDLHRLNSQSNHLHQNNYHLSLQSNSSREAQVPGQMISSTSFDASVDSYYYLEPEWRSIVDDVDSLTGRIQSQNEAIWELLQTEVFYIRRLKVINDVFIACLLNLQNECLLTEK